MWHNGEKFLTGQSLKVLIVVCKKKSFALQVWTGPDVFRRLSIPDFKRIVT
jgi:hypothetical protein